LSFSGALIEHGSLAERERELLILRVGHRTRSRYLWSQHLAMGTEAGLDPHDLQALRDSTVTDRWHARDRHLLMVADELVDDHTVSDATWSGLRDYLDEQQVLEVLFLVGSYVCLAMVLNSVGLDPQLKE
jgi:alkylhydroperoxidase family enzyme